MKIVYHLTRVSNVKTKACFIDVILLKMTKSQLSEELTWRGFVNQTTFDTPQALDGKPITFYLGVDPSASSMTIGNLAVVMMVRHFIAHGHKAILLVGGATGLIGDPDGKSEERSAISVDEITDNTVAIAKQYKAILGEDSFTLVNNYDWFKTIGYLQFLRDTGKHVPMRQMLGRDFVQKRLSEAGNGISYAEFSYVLIQAYDFLYLHQKHGVDLQICGSDQWGNSIAGVDLIRRVTGDETHVWSAPLVINKTTGIKFGKSEEGAVWLDPNLTSPYKFYQFWLNVDDGGAEDYLKIYTLLPKEEIVQIIKEFHANAGGRLAQKTLAYEVTKLVHGKERADSVQRITNVLFGGANFLDLSKTEMNMLKDELTVVAAGKDIFQTLVMAHLASSNSEARNFISNGAVSINGQKATPETALLQKGENLIKRGKNSFAIVTM